MSNTNPYPFRNEIAKHFLDNAGVDSILIVVIEAPEICDRHTSKMPVSISRRTIRVRFDFGATLESPASTFEV